MIGCGQIDIYRDQRERERERSKEPSASSSMASFVASHQPLFCSLPRSNLLSSGVHSSCSSTFFSDGRKHVAPKKLLTLRRDQQSGTVVTKAIFGLGVPELAVIAGVAAIIFGPKQLPEIGKSLGKTVKSFQQAAKEFENEVKNPTDSQLSEASSTAETPTVLTSDSEKENTQA